MLIRVLNLVLFVISGNDWSIVSLFIVAIALSSSFLFFCILSSKLVNKDEYINRVKYKYYLCVVSVQWTSVLGQKGSSS